MKLKENQLNLLRHLAKFETLDYLSCLRLLNTEKKNDRTALSYAFRPLTKNHYARKHKDGHVTLLSKGRALFPGITPFVTLGGGASGIRRVNAISRTAMFMKEADIESFTSPSETPCFVPSACWRKIRDGILSTTRFTGILFFGEHRLAVYDIREGSMEWQLRAERSLFYDRGGMYATAATGMLFICDDDDKRIDVACQIVRATMWNRKQLIDKGYVAERKKPVAYSKSPIRIASQYGHVYLTTPSLLRQSIEDIGMEMAYIARQRNGHNQLHNPKRCDFEDGAYRCFVNIATDLLKYVYFFSAAKELMAIRESNSLYKPDCKYSLMLPKRDFPIMRLYPDVLNMERAVYYEYFPEQNPASDTE